MMESLKSDYFGEEPIKLNELDYAKNRIEELENEVSSLKQEILDVVEDRKIHEKKGVAMVKELKKQLHFEKKRAEKLQEKLQEVLSDSSALSVDTSSCRKANAAGDEFESTIRINCDIFFNNSTKRLLLRQRLELSRLLELHVVAQGALQLGGARLEPILGLGRQRQGELAEPLAPLRTPASARQLRDARKGERRAGEPHHEAAAGQVGGGGEDQPPGAEHGGDGGRHLAEDAAHPALLHGGTARSAPSAAGQADREARRRLHQGQGRREPARHQPQDAADAGGDADEEHALAAQLGDAERRGGQSEEGDQ